MTVSTDIAHLTKDLQQNIATFLPDNEQLRRNLLRSARTLVSNLETPAERITRKVYHEPAIYTNTVILLDLRIFQILEISAEPQAATQLAEITGADPKLLERLLKHVATESFVQETGADTYTANGLTRYIASPEGEGTYVNSVSLLADCKH